MAHVWQIDPSPGQNQPYSNQQVQAHSHEAAAGTLVSLAGAAGQQPQPDHRLNVVQDVKQPIPTPSAQTNTQTQDTPAPEPGAFQCGFCKKSYTRPDHLIRHVRSHTQEKPYVCPICSKGFARPDLVKRHAAAHDDQNQPEPANKKRRYTQAPSTSRVTQACKACASSKLKCTEEKPCKRCQQKGWNCEYSYTDGNPSSSNTTAGEGQNQSSISTPTSQSFDPSSRLFDYQQHGSIPESGQTIQAGLGADVSYRSTHVSTPETFNQHAIDPNLTAVSNEGIHESDGVYYPGFLRQLMMASSNAYDGENAVAQHQPIYVSSSFTPHRFMDYTTGPNSVAESYDTGDFPCIDQAAYDYQFNFASSSTTDEVESGRSAPIPTVALGAEAFKRSALGEWVPTSQDHGYSEEANLSLPGQAERTVENRQSSGRRITKSPLALSTRDKMLSLVLEICRPNNVSHVVSSFPSAGLFDNLIQLYLHNHIKQLDTWLHLPTFDPNETRPELVAAIAGAGGVRTDLHSVQKLGYALQESLRNALPLRFEENNTRARSLQFHQAYFLQLDVRLWSAVGRKTELAEAFMQPGVTMIRRGRKFKLSGGWPIMPEPEDDGPKLQEIWHAWAEQESRKRLSLHVFIHDAQSSMALNVNPLISYAELTLPLPSSLDLWQAPDAASWKRLMLSRAAPVLRDPGVEGDRYEPNLPEVLKDISLLHTFASQVDIQLSRLIVLYALWALIWEHRQLNTLACDQSGPWSTLVLSSRHSEISVAIQNFRINSTTPPMAPEVRLVLECINMHLYMSLDELQLYAGKEDPRDAHKAYHSARNWINASASREAVWHAGQVVRAARSFRPNTLRDFYAVAVYHASLAFWSYSVVARGITNEGGDIASASTTYPPSHPPPLHQQPPPIYLDGEDTPDLENWIVHKARRPLLFLAAPPASVFDHQIRRSLSRENSGGNSASLTEEPAQVMEAVRDVLAGNWKGKREATPPLVENLCQLMGDLGKAAAGEARY